jgi:cytochrome c peroxidase
MKTAIYIVSILLMVVSCREDVKSLDDQIALLQLETLPEVIYPNNNPFSESKRTLGKYLFYDPILSGEKDIACVTCHLPSAGYADELDLSIGVGGVGQGGSRFNNSNARVPLLGRNSQTIVNVAYNGLVSSRQNYDPLEAPMLWDSRRRSLEIQCIGPPTVFNIMRGDAFEANVTFDTIVVRLKKIPEYDILFTEAFGANSITKENIAKAIATFERTIISKDSPYDRYVRGEKAALTEMQKFGLQLFFGKGNCANCHSGPMFSDYSAYNLGIDYNAKAPTLDKGIANAFAFRTPTLRNVELTAPYMHNGVLLTLSDVFAYYNAARRSNPESGPMDSKITALQLSENEITAITSFLNSLTDDSYDKEVLSQVPSGLKPGGN